MAKYPDWFIGQDVDATTLDLMTANITVKPGGTVRNNTTTLADDPDLASIPLAVGTHWVRLLFIWCTNTSATPDIKTRWAFTGTWNNPLRACIGPASTNTANPDVVTPVKFNTVAAGTDCVYGSAATTAFSVATEECFNVVVTVAGNLSLQWAENALSATDITVQPGSTFQNRQIA